MHRKRYILHTRSLLGNISFVLSTSQKLFFNWNANIDKSSIDCNCILNTLLTWLLLSLGQITVPSRVTSENSENFSLKENLTFEHLRKDWNAMRLSNAHSKLCCLVFTAQWQIWIEFNLQRFFLAMFFWVTFFRWWLWGWFSALKWKS